MPEQKNSILTSDLQDDQTTAESADKKTKQTIPTLYPDIDFVNRTLP